MSSDQFKNSVLAKRYAKALFDQAIEVKKLEKVESEAASLLALFVEIEELRDFAQSPIVQINERREVVDLITKQIKLSDELKGFLSVVLENNRLSDLPAMIETFNEMIAAHRGELSAEVTSAIALEDAQRKSIKSELDKQFDANVQIEEKVDPGLVGGLVVRVGSYMFDNSIKSKLNNLAIMIREGA